MYFSLAFGVTKNVILLWLNLRKIRICSSFSGGNHSSTPCSISEKIQVRHPLPCHCGHAVDSSAILRPRRHSQHNCIQMFEKFNGFQIFIVPVFICNPLSVLLAIIKIQHGRNCIHSKSVHMTFLNPEKCISYKKILYFRMLIIVNLRISVRRCFPGCVP